MQNSSLSDDDVALVYLRLVRQESADAADLIEQIYVHFNAHAALRAALIITLLKKEIEHYHTIPEIGMYTYLLVNLQNKGKEQPCPFPHSNYAGIR